jgi:hypothetical protein
MYKLISINSRLLNNSKIAFNPIPLLKSFIPEDYKKASRSEEGNVGVAFLTTKENHRFVIKREKEVSPIVFALLLSKFLGFDNPGTKFVEFDSEFSNKIISQCLATESAEQGVKFRAARNIEDIDQRTEAIENLRYIKNCRSMETMFSESYDSGNTLMIMDCSDGVSLLNLSEFEGSETNKNEIYEKLGKLLAFDLLIHNTDRLPLTYFNSEENNEGLLEGNAGNLLIDTENDALNLVLIDHTVMRCKMDYDDAQLTELQGLLQSIGDPFKTTFFDSTIDFINRHLPGKNVVNKEYLVKGFIDTVFQIGNLQETFINDIFTTSKLVDSNTDFNIDYIKGAVKIFKSISFNFDSKTLSSSMKQIIIKDIKNPSPDKLKITRDILESHSDSAALLPLLDNFELAYKRLISDKKNPDLIDAFKQQQTEFISYIGK